MRHIALILIAAVVYGQETFVDIPVQLGDPDENVVIVKYQSIKTATALRLIYNNKSNEDWVIADEQPYVYSQTMDVVRDDDGTVLGLIGSRPGFGRVRNPKFIVIRSGTSGYFVLPMEKAPFKDIRRADTLKFDLSKIRRYIPGQSEYGSIPGSIILKVESD